jgi:hypothetical protein
MVRKQNHSRVLVYLSCVSLPASKGWLADESLVYTGRLSPLAYEWVNDYFQNKLREELVPP